MDITVAATQTKRKVSDFRSPNWSVDGPLSQHHIHYMLWMIETERISGEKAHRWLGWAQAAVVSAGAGTLDEMKEINRNA